MDYELGIKLNDIKWNRSSSQCKANPMFNFCVGWLTKRFTNQPHIYYRSHCKTARNDAEFQIDDGSFFLFGIFDLSLTNLSTENVYLLLTSTRNRAHTKTSSCRNAYVLDAFTILRPSEFNRHWVIWAERTLSR